MSGRDAALREEVFGASSLVVRCPSLEAMLELVESPEGQLTAAIHIDEVDHNAAQRMLPTLERRAGRILVNGFGIGGSGPCDGLRRSVSVDFRRPLHVRRQHGNPALPAAGVLSGPARCAAAGRVEVRESTGYQPSRRPQAPG